MNQGSHRHPQGGNSGNAHGGKSPGTEFDGVQQAEAGHEAIGGLFPEGADPRLFGMTDAPDEVNGQTGGQADEQSGTQVENNGLSFDDLMKITRERVCPVCPSQKEVEEAKLRALADLENTKKRLQREKEEQCAYAAERVLNDLIPALDNLNLALQHAPQGNESKNFVIGVDMTRRLLLETLSQHGLEEVGAIGEAFDPAIHEAVGMNDIPEIPDNHISALMSKGYRLKGRLLRPAKVMVCKRNA